MTVPMILDLNTPTPPTAGTEAARPVYQTHRTRTDGGIVMTSRRVSLGILPGLILVFAWLLAPATTVAGDPCYHGFELPARQVVATSQVKLEPCAFSPTIARVPVGATVTFANEGDFTHLVTGANQEWGSRDLELHPCSKVSYTFDKAGTYPYACALHRGMSGVIVVGDGGEAGLAAPVASATPRRPAAPAPSPWPWSPPRSPVASWGRGCSRCVCGRAATASPPSPRSRPRRARARRSLRQGGSRATERPARRGALVTPRPGPTMPRWTGSPAGCRVPSGGCGSATGASNLADGIVWLLIPVLAVQLGAGPASWPWSPSRSAARCWSSGSWPAGSPIATTAG